MINLDKYNLVSILDIISYKNKDVVQIYENYWWLIYKDQVLLGKRVSAFYNQDKRIVERIFKNHKKKRNFDIRLLPVAFLPWDD